MKKLFYAEKLFGKQKHEGFPFTFEQCDWCDSRLRDAITHVIVHLLNTSFTAFAISGYNLEDVYKSLIEHVRCWDVCMYIYKAEHEIHIGYHEG